VSPTSDADGIAYGYLVISCPDGRDHLVDERLVATSPHGRFLARCGEYVISTAMGVPPGRDCPICMPRPAPPREPRRSPVRLRALLAPLRAPRPTRAGRRGA
jgi:hypothetical protein